tara:strand:- start:368 stop:1129 length:762 start_codon:yes stop_codon:yes gene_type:complete
MHSEQTHPFFQDFNFIGFVHRGGAEEATENTLEAFQHSSDMGFTFMETDIQGTKDNEIVVFHDHDLNRMAGVNKKIEELNFSEIKQIDLKGGGKIPLLEDLLISFPELRFNIDFKTDNSVEKGIEIIKKTKATERVCLASFSSSRLKRLRSLAGPKACSSMGQMEIFLQVLDSINFPAPLNEGHCAQVPTSQWGVPIVTKRFLDSIHRDNKLVHVWTIDEEPEMERLISLGVDGLMTDKPTILLKVLTEKKLI